MRNAYGEMAISWDNTNFFECWILQEKKNTTNKKQSKNNNKNQTPNILEIRTSLYIIYVIFRQKLLSDFESEGI